MPYLQTQNLAESRRLILVTAFGKLSFLEACSLYLGHIRGAKMPCDSVFTLELDDGGIIKNDALSGEWKIATPIGHLDSSEDFVTFRDEIASFLEYSKANSNFCLSLYCKEGIEEDYEDLLSGLLSAVREGGIKKANLLRPHEGTEILVREILSRRATDFVAFPSDGGIELGVTSYVPESDELRSRGTEKPVVRSDISLSPRLARVLINISGLSQGELLLDPFCGIGTILSEAVLNGINCLGIDKNPKRIADAERNLKWIRSNFQSKHLGLPSFRVGDATNAETLKDVQADAVVTEPILLPKLTSAINLVKAKKLIRNAGVTYSEFLYSVAKSVKTGGRLVIIVPSLRTFDGQDVSMSLEGLEEIRLRPYQPRTDLSFEYPIKVGFESTRWVRRNVYVFERF